MTPREMTKLIHGLEYVGFSDTEIKNFILYVESDEILDRKDLLKKKVDAGEE